MTQVKGFKFVFSIFLFGMIMGLTMLFAPSKASAAPLCNSSDVFAFRGTVCVDNVGPSTIPNYRFVKFNGTNSLIPGFSWYPDSLTTTISCKFSVVLPSGNHLIWSGTKSASGPNIGDGMNTSIPVGYTYVGSCTHTWSWMGSFPITKTTTTNVTLNL